MTLAKQVLHGSALSYGSFLFSKALLFLSTLVLARVLLPTDFGLVGYALVVMSFLDMLKTFGVTAVLIYRQDVTDELASEVFALAVLSALIFYGLCWLVAPAVGVFFHTERIVLIVRIIGLTLVLDAMGDTHRTLLEKKMQFFRRFAPVVVYNLVKGFVSVLLAFTGFGFWSLVWGQVSGSVAQLIMSWCVLPWRPRVSVRWASARVSLVYGFHVTLVAILGAVVQNADILVVGRSLGATALGLYDLALTLPLMFTLNLSVAVSQVALPAFALLQGSKRDLRAAYLLVLRYTALLLVPVGLGFCAIAPAFMHALYKPVWWPAIPALQALSVSSMLFALGWNSADVHEATGRPDLLWKLSLGHVTLLIPALMLGAYVDGFVGVAVAQILVVIPFSVARFWLIHRRTAVPYRSIATALTVPFLSGAIMLATCLAIARVTASYAPAIVMMAQIACGAVVYGATVFRLDGALRARLLRWHTRGTNAVMRDDAQNTHGSDWG